MLIPALAQAQSSPPVASQAQTEEMQQQMLRCSVIGDASARLGCFDTLSRAAVKIQTAAANAPDAQKANAAAAVPIPAVTEAPGALPESPISRTVQLWELDDASKRGRYAFRPYRPNYVLLANYSTSTNTAPYDDEKANALRAQHVELTYQLSFKMKLLEAIQDTPIDLWFGYTQESFWQAYNRKESSPFRETNYQPEFIGTLPINKRLAGIDFRYLNLGWVHQSNGQSDTQSRSWNRLYTELGVDHGNLAAQMRLWKRTDTSAKDNDNLDIIDFMGHGDLNMSYRQGGHEVSILARRNFSTDHGAVRLGWAFPVATNLKGYLQLFSGYGESLIDYNYAQKSLGAGFRIDL